MAYSRTVWNDGTAPAITGARLNNMEVGIVDAHTHMANKNNPHSVTASQVGALPVAGGTITGGITTGANRYWIGELEPRFGLDLMGSSIIGVDEIAFKQPANTDQLGLAFLKNGAPEDSAFIGNYNYFRIDGNGVPYASGSKLVRESDTVVRAGAEILMTTSGSIGYLQGGDSANDTAAELRITRRNTTESTIQNLRIYADNTYTTGRIVAGELNQQVGNQIKNAYVKDTNVIRSTANPSGGADGDLWIQY